MGEACSTPGSIPTAGPVRTPGLFTRLIRQDMPEDPKRLAVILGALGLVLALLALAVPAALWIYRHGDLGGGAVAGILGASGPLGAMVYGVHRKPDDPIALTPGGPDA